MAATVTVVKVAACGAAIAFALAVGAWFGVWWGRKQGSIPEGVSVIAHLRVATRRSRQARRELLTLGERMWLWTMLFLAVVALPAGLIVLLSGDSSLRLIGIALLILALVVMAVPVSPILQARVRRRQRANK